MRNPWVELGLASVVGVSVLVVTSTDGSKWIALLSRYLTSLVVLGQYDLCCIWELHLALRCVIRNNCFPHVLYRLWSIGLAVNYLEVVSKRGRTRMIWWWPSDEILNNSNTLGYWCSLYISTLDVYAILYVLSVKLTLSACVWRWSCAWYTWAEDVDAGGAGEAEIRSMGFSYLCFYYFWFWNNM